MAEKLPVIINNLVSRVVWYEYRGGYMQQIFAAKSTWPNHKFLYHLILFKVDKEHLAFDSVKRRGPGGNFLEDELTLDLLKSGEHFYGGSFNLSESHRPEDSMYARSHQRVQEILSSHCPRVPEKVIEEINRLVRRKEKEFSIWNLVSFDF